MKLPTMWTWQHFKWKPRKMVSIWINVEREMGGRFFLKFWKYLKGPQAGNHCFIYIPLFSFTLFLVYHSCGPSESSSIFPSLFAPALVLPTRTILMSAASLKLTTNIDFQIPCKNANNHLRSNPLGMTLIPPWALFSPPQCPHSFGSQQPSAWPRAPLPSPF